MASDGMSVVSGGGDGKACLWNFAGDFYAAPAGPSNSRKMDAHTHLWGAVWLDDGERVAIVAFMHEFMAEDVLRVCRVGSQGGDAGEGV